MESNLTAMLAYLAAVAALVGGMVWLSGALGPKNPSVKKDRPFECGILHTAPFPDTFSVKFYLVGLLFLVFDIEVGFLFPWALIFRRLGWFGFVEMLVFMLVLGVGLAYVWKRGALQWD